MTFSQPSPDLSLIPAESRELLVRAWAQADASGMPLYLAGGIVRDLLLGKPVKDIDLVVEGDAIALARALSRQHGGRVTAHAMFGTATWQLPTELVPSGRAQDSLDLATARTERYEHPGALPTVEPATIQDDLRRRDFTINAMALRLQAGKPGELLDPFGGQGDLKRRLVRVLHPNSFVDDPTRMFRAIRYARRYALEIPAETLQLFKGQACRVLSTLSGERLRHELDMILEETEAETMLRDAFQLGLLSLIYATIPPAPPGFGELLASGVEPEYGVRLERKTLGYLLWWMDLTPAILTGLQERLTLDAALARLLFGASELLLELPRLRSARPSQWTLRLDKLPLGSVHAVNLRTQEPALRSYLQNWRHIRPETNGDVLMGRGLVPGPAFKELLSRLRAAWLDGEVSSPEEEEALLEKLLRE